MGPRASRVRVLLQGEIVLGAQNLVKQSSTLKPKYVASPFPLTPALQGTTRPVPSGSRSGASTSEVLLKLPTL